MGQRITSSTLPVARLLMFVVAASLAMTVSVGSLSVSAQDADTNDQGAALVDEFITILKQSDAEKQAGLEGFLADEFQIVRSNGAVLDKAGYVANPATVFEVDISEVNAVEANDVLVVSYVLSVDEVLDGVETKTVAPRLSVFHRNPDGGWQIAAHANFGALDPS